MRPSIDVVSSNHQKHFLLNYTPFVLYSSKVCRAMLTFSETIILSSSNTLMSKGSDIAIHLFPARSFQSIESQFIVMKIENSRKKARKELNELSSMNFC